MTIVATGSVAGFFQEAVGDAMRQRKVEATPVATSYVVALLSDYTRLHDRASETMRRPLAFLLDEALHEPKPAERFEKLRSLGDGVLYVCGFFADHFTARGVDRSYLVGIGQTAYGTAGNVLSTGEGKEDIFEELSCNFERFVEVVADVADSTQAMGAGSSQSLLKVYERWLRTGSDRLAQTLSSHGLVPSRGPSGVQ